jgi:TRAP-type C4-dicarboxylate transport system permease small subunit
MDDRTRAYLVIVSITSFIMLGLPLLFLASRRNPSGDDLIIALAIFVPAGLIACFYLIWSSRRDFGPEWYKAWFKKFDVPPEFDRVSKSRRVRAFKWAGLLVLLFGVAYGTLIKQPEVAAFSAVAGYIITYQGAREQVKYLPPKARRIYESSYKIILISFIFLIALKLILKL